MELDSEKRKQSGEACIVPTLKDFQHNFNIFSEGAFADLGQSNSMLVSFKYTS